MMTTDNQTIQNPEPNQTIDKNGSNKWTLLMPIVFIALVIMAGVLYFVGEYYFFAEPKEQPKREMVKRISTTEAIEKLSGLDLSLSDIQEVERVVIHTQMKDEDERLSRKIIALKHLYSNEFLRNDHTVRNLRNIYMLYSTDFSPEQQEILKWFFSLPQHQQKQWEQVKSGVNDFHDFQQKVAPSKDGKYK